MTSLQNNCSVRSSSEQNGRKTSIAWKLFFVVSIILARGWWPSFYYCKDHGLSSDGLAWTRLCVKNALVANRSNWIQSNPRPRTSTIRSEFSMLVCNFSFVNQNWTLKKNTTKTLKFVAFIVFTEYENNPTKIHAIASIVLPTTSTQLDSRCPSLLNDIVKLPLPPNSFLAKLTQTCRIFKTFANWTRSGF